MTNYPIPFGSITPPWWDDRPVAVVGAGPSLKGFDFARLRGRWRVVAVNQKVWDLPWADACISIDIPWIRTQASAAVATGVPLYVAGPEYHQCPFVDGAVYLKRSRTVAMSDALDMLEMGCTSGYAALNFAYLKRSRFIVLFGFDYSAAGGDHDKPEQYPWHPPGHNERYWPRWAKIFSEAIPQLDKAGVRVLNASPHSTIAAFPRCSVDEGITALQASSQGDASWLRPIASTAASAAAR